MVDRPIVVGVTGASGAPYAIRLLEVLLSLGYEIHLAISPSGATVLKQELDLDVDLDRFESKSLGLNVPGPLLERISYYDFRDYLAPMASGSFLTNGMVVCPCSGGTLSAIAHGSSTNLIQRAADVHLKEGRRLVLVPRETPLSLVHLENMKRAVEGGAVMLPAMPGWYHGVTSPRDLVDFIAARILDQLGAEHGLSRRWGCESQD